MRSRLNSDVVSALLLGAGTMRHLAEVLVDAGLNPDQDLGLFEETGFRHTLARAITESLITIDSKMRPPRPVKTDISSWLESYAHISQPKHGQEVWREYLRLIWERFAPEHQESRQPILALMTVDRRLAFEPVRQFLSDQGYRLSDIIDLLYVAATSQFAGLTSSYEIVRIEAVSNVNDTADPVFSRAGIVFERSGTVDESGFIIGFHDRHLDANEKKTHFYAPGAQNPRQDYRYLIVKQ